MSAPPAIDERPDISTAALQALRGDFLHFNVAGSGPTFPVAQRAAERFRAWLNEVGMFSHVGYDAYNQALAAARADVATLLGDEGGAERVALAQSATDGLNTLVAGLRLPRGSLIVTTAEEHPSALLPVLSRQERGDRVRVLPYPDDASFLADLAAALADGAAALVLSLVSCKTGKVLPVAAACRIARAAGAVSIVDAAQAAGQIAVDVREIGADAVVILGHKWLHGPLATGAFHVADPDGFDVVRLGWRGADRDAATSGPPFAEGFRLHADATRFETGTVDAAAFVGLRQAIAVQRALGERVGERVRALRATLIERLRGLPFDLLSRPEDLTGIVVVAPHGGDAAGIVARMWSEERIVVKHISDPDMPDAIRISFWALHEEAQLDALADAFARRTAVPA